MHHQDQDTPSAQFGQIWLIQAIANHPERYEVLQVLTEGAQINTRWHSTWEQFEGSFDALNTFALPNTQVLLNIQHSQFLEAHWGSTQESLNETPWQSLAPTPDSQWWCAMRDSPLGVHAKPMLGSEYNIVRALAHHGVSVRGVHFQTPEDIPKSLQFSPVQLSELRTVVNWVRTCADQTPNIADWLRLHVQLWWHGHAAWKGRKPLLLTWLLFAICGWIGLYFWPTANTMTAKPNTQLNSTSQHAQAQQTFTQRSTHNPVVWNLWLEQMGKLGTEERANVRALHFTWVHGQGAQTIPTHIQSQVLLDRPRKRIPKGCAGFAAHEPNTLLACTAPWALEKPKPDPFQKQGSNTDTSVAQDD